MRVSAPVLLEIPVYAMEKHSTQNRKFLLFLMLKCVDEKWHNEKGGNQLGDFHIPILPQHYLDRGRLYRLLEADTGVWFLIGLSGCGKTSLLAGFCQDKERSVFWYSFGKEDNQETYFRSHFPFQLEGADGRKASCIVFDNLQVLVNRKVLCMIRSILEHDAGAHRIFFVMSDWPAACFSKYMAAGRYHMATGRELFF